MEKLMEIYINIFKEAITNANKSIKKNVLKTIWDYFG